MPVALLNCDSPKGLQILPDVPWGTKLCSWTTAPEKRQGCGCTGREPQPWYPRTQSLPKTEAKSERQRTSHPLSITRLIRLEDNNWILLESCKRHTFSKAQSKQRTKTEGKAYYEKSPLANEPHPKQQGGANGEIRSLYTQDKLRV